MDNNSISLSMCDSSTDKQQVTFARVVIYVNEIAVWLLVVKIVVVINVV